MIKFVTQYLKLASMSSTNNGSRNLQVARLVSSTQADSPRRTAATDFSIAVRATEVSHKYIAIGSRRETVETVPCDYEYRQPHTESVGLRTQNFNSHLPRSV